uniref:Reverse transcriptase domain-containing protein n=1 Tax=Leptobrachium leishanense TaxID=445787 RepID=A0A8C5LQL6_9ANUR
MKTGRSPGPDGLSIEYYKTFRSSLLPHLASVFASLQEGSSFHMATTAASITILPKPNRDHTLCANYRPISLLNSDLKMLSRVLADRLKQFLPRLVHPDQVGFVPNREARDATTRILSAIRLAQHQHIPVMLLSADADKAFDRVAWPFLFATLCRMGIGDGFMNWVRALYTRPTARVKVNGALSEPFHITNDTRQGCPLSPLLFVLYLEPLLNSIRSNEEVVGLLGRKNTHKVSAYADDLLFLVTQPSRLLPALTEELQSYGDISGFTVNADKSEFLNVTLSTTQILTIRTLYPFRWCSQKMRYLGIWLTADSSMLFAANFLPLFNTVQEDLTKWKMKTLSWIGRINVIKMNVLPRILYLFQALPILIPEAFFRSIRSTLTRFIWPTKGARLQYRTLNLPKASGGLVLPNFTWYYYAAHLTRILDWMSFGLEDRGLDLEAAVAGPHSGHCPGYLIA